MAACRFRFAIMALLIAAALPLGCGGGAGTPDDGDGTGLDGAGDANGYVYVPIGARDGARAGEVIISSVPLDDPDLEPLRGANVRADTGQVAITTTSGAYGLKGLPSGQRTLYFSGGGVTGAAQVITVQDSQTTYGTVLDPQPTGEPGCVMGYLNAEIAPGEEEDGRLWFTPLPVYEPALRPAVGVEVRVGSVTDVTDEDGFFNVWPVEPGSRTVCAEGRSGGVPVVVLDGSTVFVEEEMSIAGTGGISGRVIAFDVAADRKLAIVSGAAAASRQTGAPVSGATVWVDSGHWVETGPDGSFLVSGVPEGFHVMGAWTDDADDALSQVWVDAGATRRAGYVPASEVGAVVVEPGLAEAVFEVGDWGALYAVAQDRNGSELWDVYAFEWSSSNPAVVEVNALGLARAVGPGQAEVRATLGGVTSDPLTVTVTQVGQSNRRPGLLAYFNGVDLVLATADNRDATTVFSGWDYGLYWFGAPALAPGGRWIAFSASDGQAYADLFLLDAATGDLSQLTDTPGVFESDPAWLRVGAAWYVVYAAETNYGSELEALAWDDIVYGGYAAPYYLTDTPDVHELDPFPSPDGSALMYTETRTAAAVATRRTVEGRQAQQGRIAVLDLNAWTTRTMTDAGSYGYGEWTADGDWLIFTDLNAGEIAALPADQPGAPTTVAAPEGSGPGLVYPTAARDSACIGYRVSGPAEESGAAVWSIGMRNLETNDSGAISGPSGMVYYPSWAAATGGP